MLICICIYISIFINTHTLIHIHTYASTHIDHNESALKKSVHEDHHILPQPQEVTTHENDKRIGFIRESNIPQDWQRN